jgi:sulfur carrier protein ThiS
MPAVLILRDKQYEVKPGMTIRHALKNAGIAVESVLATRNGELINEEEILKEGDEIRLISVISGG